MNMVMTPPLNKLHKEHEHLITGEMFGKMDLGSAELIEGVIQHHMPTKRPHSRVTGLIALILGIFNRNHKLGEVHTGETGIYTRRDPDTVRGMDCAFVSHERLKDAEEDSFLTVAPELIVEVLSRSNTWTEMHDKLAEYFGVGTVVVWIVDPRREEVHVYRSLEDIQRLTINDTLTCEGVLPGFSVAVGEIFGRN